MKNLRVIFISIFLLFQISIFSRSIEMEVNNDIINFVENENIVILREEQVTKANNIQIKNKGLVYQNFDNNIYASNYFTENVGQINNDSVRYYIKENNIWFVRDGFILELKEPSVVKKTNYNCSQFPVENPNKIDGSGNLQKGSLIRWRLTNCNIVNPIGTNKLLYKSNFFYGNDPEKWYADVSNYGEIYYKNIYNNIDLKYYFTEEGLKYDFIVHPDGDLNNIAIKIDGGEELSLGSDNNLIIKTASNVIVDKNLFVYQQRNKEIVEIPAVFKLMDSNSYGFKIIGEYDEKQPLIIDPLIYSTYLGGSGDESAMDNIIDENNNVIVTGWTHSNNFPTIDGGNDTTHNGYKDIFISKLNSNGDSLLFSTFIGGKENDSALAVDIDQQGSIFITGETASSDFPTTPDANDTSFNGASLFGGDTFVCKLNSNGNVLEYSTYIGGFLMDRSYDITIDDQSNSYIIGFTNSIDFPTTPGVFDTTMNGTGTVFVTKLSWNGTKIIHSTFIGGITDDVGRSIVLDNNNNICIAGAATSFDFPTTPNAFKRKSNEPINIFVSIFNNNMTTLIFSTLIGGSSPISFYETSTNVIIDGESNIYVVGYTSANDFPCTNNAIDNSFNGNYDIFISKFTPDLSSLSYSTYIGGKGNDIAYDAVLDDHGNIYVIGETDSTDFPILDGVYDETFNGNKDVFVIQLNFTKSELLYSSYFGSTSDDIGYGISLFEDRFFCISGQAGSGYPTSNLSYSPGFNGGLVDAFILKTKTTTSAKIINLSVSRPFEYRTQTVKLSSNAIDKEDLENQLTPYFEYRTPFQSNWFNDLLGKPFYEDGSWKSNLSIPISAVVGNYDFKVRYYDTDNISTDFLYLNNSLSILNNPPIINHFNLSKSNVVIGDKLSLSVNGIDIEDEFDKLTFEPEFKHSSDIFWDYINFDNLELNGSKLELNFSIDPIMNYGYYDFRVRVNDSDSGYSEWYYLNKSLLVNPAPPELLSISLSKDEIYRSETLEIYINCSDADSSFDEMYVELQYMPLLESKWYNISAGFFDKRWEAILNIKKSWVLGTYNFRARAFDFEDNISPWHYLNDSLQVLNNVPKIINIENIPESMYRQTSKLIFINASDKEDSEDKLIIELEYRLNNDNKWQNDYLSNPSYVDNCWQFRFNLPSNAPSVKYSFRARVIDLDGNLSAFTYLNESLIVINSIPSVIAFDQNLKEVYRTENVLITASGFDLENPAGDLQCKIYFLEPSGEMWKELGVEYNISSKQWFSEYITTKTSKLGNYSFKVHLKDLEGAISKMIYSNNSVWVRNNLPEISTALDDINVRKSPYVLLLNEYGYDVETSDINLKWIVDYNSVETKLFHIEENKHNAKEYTIYPVRNKLGIDDITIILIDEDNGKTIRTDITINVDSRTDNTSSPEKEKTPISKHDESNNIWIYLLLILIITMIVLYLLFRRKKRKEEERKEEEIKIPDEREEAPEDISKSTVDTNQGLETSIMPVDSAISEPSIVLEQTVEPSPIPIPKPVETPVLPQVTQSLKQTSPDEKNEQLTNESPRVDQEIKEIERERVNLHKKEDYTENENEKVKNNNN